MNVDEPSGQERRFKRLVALLFLGTTELSDRKSPNRKRRRARLLNMTRVPSQALRRLYPFHDSRDFRAAWPAAMAMVCCHIDAVLSMIVS